MAELYAAFFRLAPNGEHTRGFIAWTGRLAPGGEHAPRELCPRRLGDT